jgi:hypothetical protein
LTVDGVKVERGESISRVGVFVAVSLLLLALSGSAVAHGGYPLRLGIRQDANLSLLAQTVLVYLREGQGITVHPTFYGSGRELRDEYGEGRVDLFLDVPEGEYLTTRCSPGGDGYFETLYPGSWIGLFAFTVSGSACSRPGLAVPPRVANDLRFTLLGETLERLLAALTGADFERLAAEAGGDVRKANEAARKLLGEKDLL